MTAAVPLTPDQIFDHIRANFTAGQRRKFLPGLLIALIQFLRDLKAHDSEYSSLAEFYTDYPLVTTGSRGGGINTWTVLVGGKPRAIRKDYDSIANWFRSGQHRFDYPSSAPHATQAWKDYIPWIEAILSYDDETLDRLEADTIDFVLTALPSQAIDPSNVHREPAQFLLFLQKFDLSKKKGETTGAAYQGTVFGYIRADAPHLQVEVGKVRTGSKREKRVGDIDARDGDKLVLSAEVKQYKFDSDDLPDLAEFSRLISLHKALGLVVALDFEDSAAARLVEMGLQPISRDDLIERVRIWDPLKQKIAMNALLYYVNFREQNSALYVRIKSFLEAIHAESVSSNEVT